MKVIYELDKDPHMLVEESRCDLEHYVRTGQIQAELVADAIAMLRRAGDLLRAAKFRGPASGILAAAGVNLERAPAKESRRE